MEGDCKEEGGGDTSCALKCSGSVWKRGEVGERREKEGEREEEGRREGSGASS